MGIFIAWNVLEITNKLRNKAEDEALFWNGFFVNDAPAFQ